MYNLEAIEKVSLDAYNKAVADADKAYEKAIKVASTTYEYAFSIDSINANEEDDEKAELERRKNAAWHNYNHARDYCSETWEAHQTARNIYEIARDDYDIANNAYKAACDAKEVDWADSEYEEEED